MNVREYLQGKKSMTCSQWVETIKKDGLEKYEQAIIQCADSLHLIKINEKASFIKAINL